MGYGKEPVVVSCDILQETPKAIQIRQEQGEDPDDFVETWLPRSQLNHISKAPKDKETGVVPARVDMPEWLAQERKLEY